MSEIKRAYARPLDLKHGRVDMTHGAGGRAMAQLITELFAKHLGNEFLGQGNDGAVLPAPTFAEPGCGWRYLLTLVIFEPSKVRLYIRPLLEKMKPMMTTSAAVQNRLA